MKNKSGFTLIELMIVVAIIAVIAAIAVPALLRSQRTSNERNAATSLKNISSAQIDFFSNDRDSNGIRDFWTRDVSGLYSLCPIMNPDPIKLLEITVAGADSNPLGAGAPAAGTHPAITSFTRSSPKAGYWYVAMTTDQSGNPYQTTTSGAAPFDQAWFNLTRYGFLCYPESKNIGQHLFILNEEHVILKRPLSGNVRPTGSVPPGSALIQAGAAGSAPVLRWPSDTEVKTDYSKLD